MALIPVAAKPNLQKHEICVQYWCPSCCTGCGKGCAPCTPKPLVVVIFLSSLFIVARECGVRLFFFAAATCSNSITIPYLTIPEQLVPIRYYPLSYKSYKLSCTFRERDGITCCRGEDFSLLSTYHKVAIYFVLESVAFYAQTKTKKKPLQNKSGFVRLAYIG